MHRTKHSTLLPWLPSLLVLLIFHALLAGLLWALQQTTLEQSKTAKGIQSFNVRFVGVVALSNI
ncbi:MAG: hypothetical protein ACJAW1_001524 [Glaciecola sp.]|jgi:hypothetical protein